METLIKSLLHTDLKPGCIYNREYIGPNEAYKKSNGKTTFVVISVGEKLVIEELYSFSGDAMTDQHRSRTTFSFPENICKEYVVYKCSDPKKWFIHKKTMTLEEAIESGAVTIENIRKIFRDQSKSFIRTDPIVHYEGGKKCLEMLAEPTEKYPYLSMVTFVFESSEDAKKKVRKIFPNAWFM